MSLALCTYKQRQFVDEYIRNGGNGTQAAISAGYSEHSAHAIACETLKKPYVKEAIEQRRADLNAMSKVSVEWRMEMLQKAAELGLDVFMDKDGNARPNSISGSVSAIAEINKMTGAHAPTKTAETDSDGNDKPSGIKIEVVSAKGASDGES